MVLQSHMQYCRLYFVSSPPKSHSLSRFLQVARSESATSSRRTLKTPFDALSSYTSSIFPNGELESQVVTYTRYLRLICRLNEIFWYKSVNWLNWFNSSSLFQPREREDAERHVLPAAREVVRPRQPRVVLHGQPHPARHRKSTSWLYLLSKFTFSKSQYYDSISLIFADVEPDPDGARDPGAHAGGRLLLRPRGHGRRDRWNHGRRRGQYSRERIISMSDSRRLFCTFFSPPF